MHTALDSDYSHLKNAYEVQSLQLIEYKQQAHYWEAQFSQLKSRELALQTELEEAYAKLAKREQQLFGRRSEKTSASRDKATDAHPEQENAKRKRGQQPGSQGHGRRDKSHLPQVDETYDLSEGDKRCSCCQLPFEELAGTDDSSVVQIINVKAYQRAIHRKRYKRHCNCDTATPKIITAPNCTKLFAKSTLQVLIEHFGDAHSGGTLSIDRYAACKAISQKGYLFSLFAGHTLAVIS